MPPDIYKEVYVRTGDSRTEVGFIFGVGIFGFILHCSFV